MLERDEISLTNTNYLFSCAMNSIHMGYLFPITKIGIKDQTKDIILKKNKYIRPIELCNKMTIDRQ